MRRFLPHIIVFCSFLSLAHSGLAQYELWVDDYVFVCEASADSIGKKLRNGLNAMLLEVEETSNGYAIVNSEDHKPLDEVFSEVSQFLNKDTQIIVALMLKGEVNEDSISLQLTSTFGHKVFVGGKEWPKMSALEEQGIQIVVIFEPDLTSTSVWQVRSEKKYERRFSKDPLNKFVLLHSEATEDSTLLNECYEVWKQTGKPPNFIVAKSLGRKSVGWVADSLNSTRRFRGEAYYNEQPLDQINWYNTPGVITPARFSFPLTSEEQILSPYKNGYRIAPSEVIHHGNMIDEPRLLTAYDIPIDDKLIYDFSFDQEILNSVEPEWSNSIAKDVSFISDENRGEVLYLSSHNSFIDYSKENILNFETPTSISVWVRPDSLPDYTGIVGFGTAFSLKLKDGNPDFTTATIKDHIINWKLDLDKWYHLVAIRNPGGTVDFFINGEKIGESVTSDIIPSNQSLVIGNNIWGEQFYGSIDDLKIWNRGLSPKEISLLYKRGQIREKKFNYWDILLILVVVVAGALVFRKRNKTSSTTQPTREYIAKEGVPKNSLRLFGSFRVLSGKNGETSSAFSPLLRQILAYLVLKTAESEEGVNTNKLTETFWPGISKGKAKENRGANIKKLRKALTGVEGLTVVFEDKKWHVETSADFFVDILEYSELKNIIEQDISNGVVQLSSLNALLDLLQHGNILQNIHTEWVDHFKNKISNEVDTLLSRAYKTFGPELDVEVKVKLANTILLFDSLNEDALRILIKGLVTSGKHGQAQNAYESFAKNYVALYAEPFGVGYQEIVEMK